MSPDPIEDGDRGDSSAAIEHGRICAVAADCQGDLQSCAERYPGLLPPDPFDPRLFSSVALANAFGSPWETPDRLRIATRTSLWVFAADWLVDYVAKSRGEIDELVRGCLAVADGGPAAAGAPIICFLGDIRDELTTMTPFTTFHPIWRDQLERYLTAMTREWEWKATRTADRGEALPSFEEYLSNSDNFGSSWVNVSHWIFTSGPSALERLDDLRVASQEVQRVLRLLNDLASYERDLRWGDLNALMLGADRDDLAKRIAVLVDNARALLQPLKAVCPQEARYLERQIGYSTGFYGLTDYWG